MYSSYLKKGYRKLDLVYKNYNNNIKRRDYFAVNPIIRGRGNNYRGYSRRDRSIINTIPKE